MCEMCELEAKLAARSCMMQYQKALEDFVVCETVHARARLTKTSNN